MSTHFSRRCEREKRFMIKEIHGECLRRIGVNNYNGGYAIIDTWATPKVDDLVFCFKKHENIGGRIKQVKRIEGDTYIVGTAYLDSTRDFEFEAGEIMGVVIETYGKFPNNYREYVRPTHLRKKKLRKESEDTE